MHMLPLARLTAVVAAFSLLTDGPAEAQWSSNPSQNLAIADRTGEQVQPKIRATSAGGAYISWFDNHAGGYDVHLQRVNHLGAAQWPHNGVLIADRSFSSTQDYGLAVDSTDYALLAFRDDRSGAVHITAQRVSPGGAMPWGIAGVQVTTNPNAGNSPRVAAASDDHVIVGWTEGAGIRLQRLDPSGAPQWASGGIALAPPTGSYTLSDLVGSDNGAVIALWVRPTGGISSPRHLYAQKFSTSGTPLWNSGNPVIIFDSTSIQLGYFPTFVSDGAGGAVFGWYETGTPRNCYVQRVDVAGNVLFPHNGVPVSTLAGNIRLSPAVAYSPATGDTYLFWTEANSVQSMWGLYGQRISPTGQRLWSDFGKEIIPLSGNQTSFINALATDDGAMVFCFDRSGPSYLVGARLDRDGNHLWPGAPGGVRQVSSVLSGKSRLSVTLNSCFEALLAWSDARNDSGDIFAQNVRGPTGKLGARRAGDADDDGVVNVNDLLAVINSWGACPAKGACPGDVFPFASCAPGDGAVNVNDLLQVINNWG